MPTKIPENPLKFLYRLSTFSFGNMIEICEFALNRYKISKLRFLKKSFYCIENLLEILDNVFISRIDILAMAPVKINAVSLELNELVILRVYKQYSGKWNTGNSVY